MENPTPETVMVEEKPIAKANFLIPTLITSLIIALVFGTAGYLLGQKRSKLLPETLPAPTLSDTVISTPTIIPTPTVEASVYGKTTYSFRENGQETLIKVTVEMLKPMVEYVNLKERKVNRVFVQQAPKGFEPLELSSEIGDSGNWTELIVEPIKNPTNAASILIADSLFSFKQIPNTRKFLFVSDMSRNIGPVGGPWVPDQMEKALYLYDPDSGTKLKKIQVFDKSFKYSFPKLDQFSSEGRYVELKLFGCWGCGGHMPETYLLDLQTLMAKNIGKVSYFEWQDGGNYGYKDYIVIECTEPGPGDCSKDPKDLPMKTGSI